MSKMFDSEYAVPGIEASDLNDGDIIAMSQVEEGADGRVRFHATLPSQRKIESDWIMQDNLRKMRLQWVEAVKQHIIADAQAALETSMALMREKQMNEKRLDIPELYEGDDTGTALASAARSHLPGKQALPTALAPPADPVEYAQSMAIAAELQVQEHGEARLIALAKEKAAKVAAVRWWKIYESLK